MLLLCNNIKLDLYDDTGLQFKHTNPLFAFDKLECERTTQFKLPTTPANDRAFALARIPAYAGTGMRRKFSAQLQAGTIVKDGYLYVSEFDGKDYIAIFVTGELVSLQTIKNAGVMGNYYTNPATATYGSVDAYPGSTIFQTLRYANRSINPQGVGVYTVEDTRLRPCISLYLLMVYVLQQYWGVTIPNYPNALRDLVYIPEKYVNGQGEEINTFGTPIAFNDNIPEWDGVQLIQLVCDALGYLPNYENSTLTFVQLISQLDAAIDLTPKLTKRGKVERTLAGFSKHNYIRWKDADLYGGLAASYLDYFIDNDNIENSRELGELPAQPSNRVTPYSYPNYNDVALCWDKYSQSYIDPEIKNPMGAEWFAFWRIYTGSSNEEKALLQGWYVLPSSPRSNEIMQAICTQATQIKVEARMTMLEYYAIGSKTTLQVDGSRYVWLERSWQNNTATFTLAKIS